MTAGEFKPGWLQRSVAASLERLSRLPRAYGGTPVSPQGLLRYDRLPPAEAARRAWTNAGTNPQAHRAAKDHVRMVMPLLARALDRMEEQG